MNNEIFVIFKSALVYLYVLFLIELFPYGTFSENNENGKKVLKFKFDYSENTETGKTVVKFTFYYCENKEIGKKLSNLHSIVC